MNRFILLFSLAVSSTFAAAPYAVRSTQLSPTGALSPAQVIDLAPPVSGLYGFNIIDGSSANKRPIMASMSSTIFDVGTVTGTSPDFQAPLGIKTSFITGIIDTYVGGGSSASNLIARIAADEADMVTMQANMVSVDADILSLQSSKEPTISSGTTGQYWRGDKTWQALPTLDSMGIEAWAAAKNYATNGALTSGLAGKFDTPTGTTAQYVRGNGTLATLPVALARSFTAPSRAIVTSTSATGFQVSATRDSQVSYEGSFQTTSTIGGPSSITIFLETADTNSTTPGDWTTIATQVNSNTITLAVVLQQVDIEPWGLSRIIPAGKYVRIRSGSISGTATATINAQQQEVLLP